MAKDIDKNPDMKRLLEWLQIKLHVVTESKEQWRAYTAVNDFIRLDLGYDKEWEPPDSLFA